MIILKINPRNPKKDIINEAARILRNGGVVVYPTDTAYALGGIYNNRKVVNKILKIKKRRDKRFTLVVAGLNQFKKFFKPNWESWQLAKEFWPGPLSIVVSSNYAVRMPKNKIARLLAKKVGRPLIATSANISGKQTPYNIKEILRQLGESNRVIPPYPSSTKKGSGRVSPLKVKGKSKGVMRVKEKGWLEIPNLILDAGSLKKNKPSTIVKATRKRIEIIRQGDLKIY